MDIVPTFLDSANIAAPNGDFKGRPVHDIQGISMLSEIQGSQNKERVLGWELSGRSAIRKGDWKIRYIDAPFGPGEWELFNLKDDPSESHDLSKANPKKFRELTLEWERYVEDNGVIKIDPNQAKKIGYGFILCHYGKCLEN